MKNLFNLKLTRIGDLEVIIVDGNMKVVQYEYWTRGAMKSCTTLYEGTATASKCRKYLGIK